MLARVEAPGSDLEGHSRYTYDILSRVLTETKSAPDVLDQGRVTETKLNGRPLSTATYDAPGQLVQTTRPAPEAQVLKLVRPPTTTRSLRVSPRANRRSRRAHRICPRCPWRDQNSAWAALRAPTQKSPVFVIVKAGFACCLLAVLPIFKRIQL